MRSLRQWSVRHAVALKRTYDFSLLLLPPMRWVLRRVGRGALDRALRPIERAVKTTFFDCKMCGQCALSSTGMACPTNCAKSMRNGPCGGVRPNGNCEVVPSMRCVWVEATSGRKRLARANIPSAITLAPIDYRLMGSSSWAGVIAGDPPPEKLSPAAPRLAGGTDASGGAPRELHSFERACRSERLVITVEVAPPDSVDPAVLLDRARHFDGLVDAINITDGAGGSCHMSSVAASAILAANGHTPISQASCRDRNRIGLQGDVLGAAALGIRNLLCLTGDDVSNGDHPMAKPVFDLDSVSLLRIIRRMRDSAEFASGRKLLSAPNLFLGATANPFMPPYTDRVDNLEAKVDAGARFIQTQFCFDLGMLEAFMREVRVRGLHRRCAIIVGLGALGSAKGLARMRDFVPGVHIPDSVIARVAAAADQKAEGKRLLIEMMGAVAAIDGVAGIHVMGFKNEKLLAEAIGESGLRGRLRSAHQATQSSGG